MSALFAVQVMNKVVDRLTERNLVYEGEGTCKKGQKPANEKIKQERNNQWWRDKSRLCKRGGKAQAET